MRKKLTLTIDSEVYDMIKELPRKVSISEAVSFLLKGMFQQFKRGSEFTQEEFEKWASSSPEMKEVREQLREQWGPGIRKIDSSVEKVKKAVSSKKVKK